MKGFTLIEIMIVITIIGLLAVLFIPFDKTTREEQVLSSPERQEVGIEVNPEIEVEDSMEEVCIDDVVYLLLVRNGREFMTVKETPYGDNERCYQ